MKRVIKIVLALWLVVVSFAGGHAWTINQLASTPRYIYSGLQMDQWAYGPDVDASVEMWKNQVGRRFPNAYILVCHGTDDGEQWVTQPENGFPSEPVRDLALRLRARFPGRDIVLIMCNPAGRKLNIPGVYHALNNVWFVPDEELAGRGEPEVVGNIHEFVDGKVDK